MDKIDEYQKRQERVTKRTIEQLEKIADKEEND